MNFLNTFKHLLPRAKAWNLTVDKRLRQFFTGLASTGDDGKAFFDNVWLDAFPATTRDLDSWEDQFNLRTVGLSDADRRTRLTASWRALGGQSPKYIQDILQANGFNVYVHEWWVPGTEPTPGTPGTATARNPHEWLRPTYYSLPQKMECGETLAACGEALAECGNVLNQPGYPVVNKLYETAPDYITLCGEAEAACGESNAECNNYLQFTERVIPYTVPTNPVYFPYFLYIGGEIFGQIAEVEESRRNEFENLCLKHAPTQNWLGILVEYI
jgi:hypothetical protein